MYANITWKIKSEEHTAITGGASKTSTFFINLLLLAIKRETNVNNLPWEHQVKIHFSEQIVFLLCSFLCKTILYC